MSTEAHKALIRRHFAEVTNGKDLAALDLHLAHDYIDHEAPAWQAPGPPGAREYLTGVFEALPDFHATIEDIVAEGDRVVVRNVWRGTHLGHYHGLPPTGNRIALKGIVIFRIADGKIAERWATLDELSLMQQLGLIQRPGVIPGGPAAA